MIFLREGSGRGLRRDKSQVAEELGAAAVIEVQPGSDVARNWASNLPFRYNSANYEGAEARESYYETRMKLPGDKISRSPIQISVSDRVTDAMLDGTTIDLYAFQKEVSNFLKPASLELYQSLPGAGGVNSTEHRRFRPEPGCKFQTY